MQKLWMLAITATMLFAAPIALAQVYDDPPPARRSAPRQRPDAQPDVGRR